MGYEFDPTRPIYLQIRAEIKKRAVRGQYGPGARVPPVRELALEMGVNPNTVSRAYMELEREGFLFTRRGQGCFVTEEHNRIETERRQLADAAGERLVGEIRELDLGPGQIKELLARLEEELR